ncbi:MAG: hypothetical protein NTW21_21805 [Verrucomicrobia bacterium]|nr:hypothetical protein [Verrucomicrobiota bacterium]
MNLRPAWMTWGALGLTLLWYNSGAKGGEALFTATELHSLKDDIGETRNVATDHPEIVKRLLTLAHKAARRNKAAEAETTRKNNQEPQ